MFRRTGETLADSSATCEPETPAVEKHHVHHSYMWLGSLRIAGITLFATAISMGSSLIGVIAEGDTSTPEGLRITLIIFGLCALVVLLIVAAVVVYQVVSYKHLYYEITPAEFNFYQGILSKKRVHVPYQRIQSVDQRASLLQRIAGVCTVNIDTAGGSNNKAIVVPYLTKQDAESLRRELFARKNLAMAMEFASPGLSERLSVVGRPGADLQVDFAPSNILDVPADVWEQFSGVFGGQAVDTGKITYEYGLTNKELILTGLSNNTAFALVVLGVLGGIMQIAETVFSFIPSESEHWVDAMMESAATDVLSSAVLAGAVGLVGVIAFVWLMSALATCVSYGGFRACRRGSRIEVERGLLQHQFQGVDIDRVQSVTIKQSFIRRLMGYCEIVVGKVDAAAEGNDGQQSASLQHGVVVHPFVKVDKVAEVLNGLIPEYADVPHESTPLSPKALRRAITRRAIVQGFGFWLAVTVVVCHIIAHTLDPMLGPDFASALSYIDMTAAVCYLCAAVLLAIDVAGAVLWARESSFAANRQFMQVSNGGLTRETVSFPRGKIQFGYVKANPLQRSAKTATINARTAAGVGGTTVRLIDVREEDAQEWLSWLKPHGNVVE